MWHFSSQQDSDKLDLPSKPILRFIFKDQTLGTRIYLKGQRTVSLRNKHLPLLNLHLPGYSRYLWLSEIFIKDMSYLCSSNYFSLGGQYIVSAHALYHLLWYQLPQLLGNKILALLSRTLSHFSVRF